MTTSLDRRDFLKSASAAAAGSLSLRSGAAAQSKNKSKAASPRFFSGCCAYSYRRDFAKGAITMEDFILKAVDQGIDGVDVTTYYLKSTEPSYLVGLRRLAFRNGVLFSGVGISTNMCQPDRGARATEVEKIKKWVDATDILGTSHLRVFGGEVPKGATNEQGIQWVVETMKPACEYAARKGITLGIENWIGITRKAPNVVEILKRVNSPFAGCNLDVGNFLENPYAEIEMCIPYATHAHIRDIYGPPSRPLDLDRVWQMFAKAGYKGFMSAEYGGVEEDPTTGIPKLLAKIKTLCKKYSTA